jgi:teichuronic acid biosynthesis glycosyltransferase TuaC
MRGGDSGVSAHPPHVAVVTSIFPTPANPTVAPYIPQTVNALAKLAPTTLYVLKPTIAMWRRPSQFALSQTGLTVVPVPYPSLPFIGRSLNGYAVARAIQPHLARDRPDVVLAYWVYPDGFGAALAANRLGIPSVVGGLGTDIVGRKGRIARLTSIAISQADLLIVVSQHMRATAIRTLGADPGAVRTIINGVDANIFRPGSRDAARMALGIPLEAELIVFVGRLITAKGVYDLLSAFSLLTTHRKAVRLAFVGIGPVRAKIIRQAHSEGLAPRLHFPGAVPLPEVAQWIAAANLVCLPSYSEGYPNVLVEALACGRPIVATNVGGIPEIVDETAGRLVPPRQIQSLHDALEHVLDRQWDEHALAAKAARSWRDVAVDTLQACVDVVQRTH